MPESAFAHVRFSRTTPQVIRTLAGAQICAMSKCSPGSDTVRGLTRVELKRRYQLLKSEVDSHGKGSGTAPTIRFYIAKLSIEWCFEWVRIWVASELRPGTCPERAVYRHERKHVTAAEAVLRRYGQDLEAAFHGSGLPTSAKPDIVSNNPAALKRAETSVHGRIVAILKGEYTHGKLQRMYNDIDAAWNRIDTKAEKARVRMSCPARSWPSF